MYVVDIDYGTIYQASAKLWYVYEYNKSYVLWIGDTLARPESSKTIELWASLFHVNSKMIDMIHRMVRQYFTSYRKVLPLWFMEVRRIHINKKTHISEYQPFSLDEKLMIHYGPTQQWQHMIIVPDLYTGYAMGRPAIIYSGTTVVQWSKTRSALRIGEISTIICTPSQIFWERYDLRHISVIDSHKRSYKHQSDPRYNAYECAVRLGEVYWAKVQTLSTGVDFEQMTTIPM